MQGMKIFTILMLCFLLLVEVFTRAPYNAAVARVQQQLKILDMIRVWLTVSGGKTLLWLCNSFK